MQLVRNDVEIKKDFSKFRPIIAKEVRNFSKRYNTHLSAHLQVYKNFIDIEVIYLGTDFSVRTNKGLRRTSASSPSWLLRVQGGEDDHPPTMTS